MNVDEACELATRVSPCVEIEYYFAVYFTIFASLHLKCCITELLHRAGFLVAQRGGESTYPVLTNLTLKSKFILAFISTAFIVVRRWLNFS